MEQLSEIAQDQSTPIALMSNNLLDMPEGGLPDFLNWWLVLRAAREKRGAIDFETVETRIIFDQQRKIESIVPVIRNDAHKLIEECMLCANVATARFYEANGLPILQVNGWIEDHDRAPIQAIAAFYPPPA